MTEGKKKLSALQKFRADLSRYFSELDHPESLYERVRTVFVTEAIWVIGLYRFGQYLHQEASFPVRTALRLPYSVVLRRMHRSVGIHLYPSTEIGPGLYIGHYGGIWISPRASLGDNCNISHEVTIGVAGHGRAAPKLGDRVWVGPSATISGPVTVGSGAVIAANSLVVANVPDNAVMIGVPARVMSYGGSERLIHFNPTGSPGAPAASPSSPASPAPPTKRGDGT